MHGMWDVHVETEKKEGWTVEEWVPHVNGTGEV